MKLKPNYWVLGYACLAFVVSLVTVFYLPEQVPTHWNIYGQIDDYGSKYIYLIFGFLGIFGYFLIGGLRKIDPYSDKIEKNLAAYGAIRDIVSVLFSTMTLISIASVLIKEINISQIMMVVMGIFMVVIGNMMPRIPHNYFAGIKTPWSLNDEGNWKKTHRFGGFCFVISGIMIVIAGILKAKWLIAVAFSSLLLCLVFVCIYSWYIYNKQRKS